MKVSCESCGAQYDLDERRIPPSGITMKCPACLHQFQVKKPGAAAPPPPPAAVPPPKREVALSPIEDEVDLPAPKPKSDPKLKPKSDPKLIPPVSPKLAIPLSKAKDDEVDL